MSDKEKLQRSASLQPLILKDYEIDGKAATELENIQQEKIRYFFHLITN